MTTAEETSAASQLVELRAAHREICRALNIDDDAERRSWHSFETTRSKYDLTGDARHWMCCALYVACLQELPVVGHADHYIQGNGVNITKLLRQCGISISEFFSKMNDWSSVTSLPARLRQSVDNLHHEFYVSITAYTGFNKDFPRVLNEANITPDEPKRNKKAKPGPCSYNRLREFTWVLFLCVKEQHQEQRRDQTTAMNLTVCVIDLIYRNVVADGRLDLINPTVLQPGDGGTNDGSDGDNLGEDAIASASAKKLNIMALLCNGCTTTCESVAETNSTIFLPTLSSMFEAGDLRGIQSPSESGGQFLGLVSVANFEENLKSLNRRYERAILRCGMLDERIALSTTRLPASSSSHRAGYPRTPLSVKSRGAGSRTGAGLVGPGVAGDSGVVESFVLRGTLTQLMKKIQGYEPGRPSETFLILMKNCPTSPLKNIQDRLCRLRERFVCKLTTDGWNPRSVQARFDSIESLYYLLLENIIPWELRKRPAYAISKVIYDMCTGINMFNETVCVCAAEIIFFLREEQNNFPWMLQVFDMQPFDFYRIIEVTVSANNDILTPEIVNHLRRIEEQSLDSLCWKSSSILWEKMEKENYEIPASKDVEQGAGITGVTPLKGDSLPNTPNGSTRDGFAAGIAAIGTGSSSTSATVSATGRPVPHPDSAKKKLFSDPPSSTTLKAATAQPMAVATSSSSSSSSSTSSTPSSSSSSSAAAASAGSVMLSPSPSKAGSEMANAPGNGVNNSKDASLISSISSPQRGNNGQPSSGTCSLNLFFRKMYLVANARLSNLCQNLGLESENIQNLIWTIFEFTITRFSRELMRDRHLDQLLMCAIFVTIRIKKLDKTFKEIMHCYHNQPQANSAIYRSVFIKHNSPPKQEQETDSEVNGGTNGSANNAPVDGQQPGRCAVTEVASTSVEYDREVYGDIIKFYNDIYVVILHPFAMQFYNADMSQESLFLSPPPKTQVRNIQKSPRQISGNIKLFVSTTDKTTGSGLLDSPNIRTYTFPASPGQSPMLHDRNTPLVIRRKTETCVRNLIEPCDFDQSLPKVRRLDKIHQERRHQDQKEDDENGS